MDLIAQRGHRPLARPAVAEELDDPELLPRPQLGAHRHAVRGRVRSRPQVSVPSGPSTMWSIAAAMRKPLALRAVHEADPKVVVAVVLGHQRYLERRRLAGIVGDTPDGHRLVGHQLRLNADAGRGPDRLDLVHDRGDRALHERHQPGRAHVDGLPGRRDPLALPPQHPFAQVERALVAHELAVADVERLVVDQQPEHLAVGDVDDRLSRLGVAVGRLGVRQRAHLVEAVQERAGRARRLALVEVRPQADVPVGEREDRLGLGQQVEIEFALGDRPRLDGEHVGVPIIARSSSSSRSPTTTSAPCARSASAWPVRSTPTTQPKRPARPASTPASASSNTAACAGSAPSARAPARKVSGAGLPAR